MGKTIALNVYMDEDTLTKFKVKCIKERKSMKSVIIDFVEAYGEDEENEPSIEPGKKVKTEED